MQILALVWLAGTVAIGAWVLSVIWLDRQTDGRAVFLGVGATVAVAWLPLLAAVPIGGAVYLVARRGRRRR